MLSREDFIRYSLEHNLFFLRIMKEHLIFAAAALPVKNPSLVQPTLEVKNQVEQLLAETVRMANGALSHAVLQSGQFVTPFTLRAEMVTQTYTAIPINTAITQAEMNLVPGGNINPMLEAAVTMLNQQAIALTNQVIMLKTTLGNAVRTCELFTFLYPSLLRHVLEEARFYLKILMMLQKRENIRTIRSIIEHEIFWNHIMEEHAEFIRGLLDPSEKPLIAKANEFAQAFDVLVRRAREAAVNPSLLPAVTAESMRETRELRDFKAQGTQGGLECRIKSIILPLLSDHVLREANQYLYILRTFERNDMY